MKLYESNEYRATKAWPYAIAAGCVVYRMLKGKVEILLLKRAAGQFPHLRDGHIDSYHLPKGHVVIGETLEQTAIRETAEEAGVIVEIQTYLGSRSNKYFDQKVQQDKSVHYFAGLWQNDLEGIDDEHSETLWLSFEDALKYIGTHNPKREDLVVERLRKFLELTDAT